MRAAIYSRKSKITGQGESVENQVQLCKQYGNNIGITDFIIYEDEGFSGKNIDRPEFQRMLKDAKSKRFDTLICYRLDRISRNIADFSKLITELQTFNIGFISIREQFDTTTPMGRAMMYIASVFAQLERETIAERIKDNMVELSKTGRWLGGTTPYGFKSVPVIYSDGINEKKMFKLEPIDEEIEVIKLIYDKYLELGSLFKVCQYLVFNDFKTRTGGNWTTSTIRQFIDNPVYATATEEVFIYLKALGVTVVGNPSNDVGFMPFNRSGENKRRRKEKEWICAVGQHKGIIEGFKWVQAQKQRSNRYANNSTNDDGKACLTGILKCAYCNGPMTILYGPKKQDGSRNYYYRCVNKKNLTKEKCDNKNIEMNKIESFVINELKSISVNREMYLKEFYKANKKKPDDTLKEIEKINKTLNKNNAAISNLVKQLSLLSSEASTYIINEIEKLTKENNSLKNKLLELENKKLDSEVDKINHELYIHNLKEFGDIIDSCETLSEKRAAIHKVIKLINFDGINEHIEIKLIGAD